jgi:hypothetical protein
MTASSTPAITLSIVSHAQGTLVDRLLGDLGRLQDGSFDVVVTLNVPEDEAFLARHASLPMKVLRNERPKGYGGNHNAAFATACRAPAFAVLNPDLRLDALPTPALLETLRSRTGSGACAPLVLSPRGQPEDSVRRFPTVGRLLRRTLMDRREPDYHAVDGTQQVDWVAGMFVLFDAQAFRAVGGYDEGYFMYLEDADICRRMAHRGLSTWWVPAASVVHDARRSSRRQLRPLVWHLSSAWRFLVVNRIVQGRVGSLPT